MATENQVQTLAKQLIQLIGKMDKDYETKVFNTSQEGVNEVISKELIKKNIKND